MIIAENRTSFTLPHYDNAGHHLAIQVLGVIRSDRWAVSHVSDGSTWHGCSGRLGQKSNNCSVPATRRRTACDYPDDPVRLTAVLFRSAKVVFHAWKPLLLELVFQISFMPQVGNFTGVNARRMAGNRSSRDFLTLTRTGCVVRCFGEPSWLSYALLRRTGIIRSYSRRVLTHKVQFC